MAEKKEETKKSNAQKTSSTKKTTASKAPKKQAEKNVPAATFLDLTQDFNDFKIFDVFLYREVFMEVRRQVDELYSKREKSEKALAEYDDAIYNIIANSITEPSAQDFMSFCFKKGFYDFCLMNYEKYMKWSILAASNGNAFTLSKLQIYLTTAIDKLYQIEGLELLADFLDLTDENFVMFLSKMLCEEIVNILGISAEELIKMPEKYVEQNEELLKTFDKAKMDACQVVEEKIKKAIEDLVERLKKMEQRKLEQKETLKEESPVALEKEEAEGSLEEKPQQKENKFKRPAIKKKFRY